MRRFVSAGVLLLIFLIAYPLQATDWAAIERDYVAKRAHCLQQGIPACYSTQSGNGILVSDPRPEFGLGIHEFTPAVIGNLQKARIRFVRITMYWGLVENTQTAGCYDKDQLARWDVIVDLFRKHQMIPVIVVHSNPPGATFTTREASYQRFAQFMRMVVIRYPSVHYWELFYEMDGAFTDLFGAGVIPEVPMRLRGQFMPPC